MWLGRVWACLCCASMFSTIIADGPMSVLLSIHYFGSRDRLCRDTISAQKYHGYACALMIKFLSLHVLMLVLCLVGPCVVELACWRVLEMNSHFFYLGSWPYGKQH